MNSTDLLRENERLQRELEEARRQIHLKDQAIRIQEHEIKKLLERIYCRKREGIPGPLLPFPELNESEPEIVSPDASGEEDAYEEVEVKPRVRRAARMPKDLPRKRKVLPTSEEDKVCTQCHGAMHAMGEEVQEKLNYEPASFYIQETVRTKYACRNCEDRVVVAPLPPQVMDRGFLGTGLLAQVLVAKYSDHIPLHRQADMYSRQNIDISKSTLCEAVQAAVKWFTPLVDLMRDRVLLSYVIHNDDTPVTMIDKEAKGGSRRAYLWVYLGDEGDVVYDFTTTRSGTAPRKFLAGYQGCLQVDAFAGYNQLFVNGRVVEVGCMAHARRKFFHAKDLYPKESEEAMAMIRALYKIERLASEREMNFEERESLRRERSIPILKEMKKWLELKKNEILPKSALGRAIQYSLRNWRALTRYSEDGRLNIDNNPAERALRPAAVGRKNWMFAGNVVGGNCAAVMYSILYTCRRIRINPFVYLEDVLNRIPTHPADRLWELTPRGWKEIRDAAAAKA